MSIKKKPKTKTTNDTAQILTTLGNLESEFRKEFQLLHSGQAELRVELRSGFSNVERQLQDQRAGLIKMKDEILGAFDGSSLIPDISLKIDRHEKRIENLEQKTTVFEAALKVKDKPLG